MYLFINDEGSLFFPYADYAIGCGLESESRKLYCIGGGYDGIYKDDVISFDGLSFKNETSLSFTMYNTGNHVSIINGIIYSVDRNRNYLSIYNISNGNSIQQYSSYPTP